MLGYFTVFVFPLGRYGKIQSKWKEIKMEKKNSFHFFELFIYHSSLLFFQMTILLNTTKYCVLYTHTQTYIEALQKIKGFLSANPNRSYNVARNCILLGKYMTLQRCYWKVVIKYFPNHSSLPSFNHWKYRTGRTCGHITLKKRFPYDHQS